MVIILISLSKVPVRYFGKTNLEENVYFELPPLIGEQVEQKYKELLLKKHSTLASQTEHSKFGEALFSVVSLALLSLTILSAQSWDMEREARAGRLGAPSERLRTTSSLSSGILNHRSRSHSRDRKEKKKDKRAVSRKPRRQ
eukprot:GHVP01037794.1.p1 GENE.GHVP01037794.1~~GHVP01037794.1.p1  ORF type:complete len:142 (-),score=26.15 GHVP01037794.1:11-436(-)